MDQILSELYDHRFTVGAVSWYLLSAAIISMPPKDEPFAFRGWFYDFTHLLLNARPIPPAFRQTEQLLLSQTSSPSGAVRSETTKTIDQVSTGALPK
jgi:hypothetical protein